MQLALLALRLTYLAIPCILAMTVSMPMSVPVLITMMVTGSLLAALVHA